MEIITALGNEKLARKIKEKGIADINKTDIQYQEAVLEILEKNKNINLLILSSILPGEKNIYEFINLIKYKNQNLEIIIILEKENAKLEEFIISKGINNIYYNNKITINEILEKINEIKNNLKTNHKKNEIEKIILKKNVKNKENKLKKIKNKINYSKNKINCLKNKIKNKKIEKNKIENKKIISIIGEEKVGKSIFSLFLSLNIKNKKILIIDFDIEKNDIKKIIGKKRKGEKNIINWKKMIDIFIVFEKNWCKNNLQKKENMESFLNKVSEKYEYIIIDVGKTEGKEQILKKSQKIILLTEANLLGISNTRRILEKLMKKGKQQKDNIKIVYNKNTKTSIPRIFLDKIFSDFEILGQIQYDNYYNFFINTNAKYNSKKISKEFLKIAKKI